MSGKKYIFDKAVAQQKLKRLALEVAEQLHGDTAELVIIGIKESGVVIAQKIAAYLQSEAAIQATTISISINKQHPATVALSESIVLDNKNVLIVDDVANSGRTLMYALQPILQYLPKRVQVLVLVQRMHQLFPVKPDYVGLSLATTLQDFIKVEAQNGEILGAYLD